MQLLSKSQAAVSVALLLAAAIPGQQGEPSNQLPGQPEFEIGQRPNTPTSAISQAVGISMLDGTLVGGGPDYAVRFGTGGVAFTPAMPTAERLFPVSMAVVSYGRGAATQVPSAAHLSHRDNTAYYHRDGFVESYEVRPDGLKQSFTFAQLPSGNGDLIVCVQIDTDLQLQAERGPDGELNFQHGNLGGVTIGKVLGIDNNGAQVTGSMRYEAGSLELRLPESFVSQAALPLVLDPLVGSAFTAASAWDDSDLDVAYDATDNVYLAVWRRRFSATSWGMRAQRINDSGGLIGGFITVETLAASATPRVANISTEDAFLVVYAQSGNILGRSVLAGTGVVSSQGIIRDTADTLINPDVGGEAAADNEGIVVWHNATTGEIEAKQVNVDGDVSPPTIAPFTAVVLIGDVATTWSNSAPRISNSGGITGHHCIVWSRQFTSSSSTTVRAALVSRNLTILDSFLAPTNTGDGDSDLPSVDGDGRNWIVAWENEATPASGDNNVQARAIGYDANAAAPNQGYLASGIVDIEAGINDDERVANVTWMGDSVLVMYEDETGVAGDFDVYAQPVDLFTALDCDFRSLVDAAGGDQGPIRAASKATGGGTDDDALIVWSERDLTTQDNEGYAIRFRADDGINTNLGGGCGTGGASYAGCAMAGNASFRARLQGSLPATTAWWVVSPSRIDIPCGSCSLVPDPFSGFIITRTTDARGDASVAASIPSGTALVGAIFYQQWLIMDTTSAACPTFGSDLSDALQTQIQ